MNQTVKQAHLGQFIVEYFTEYTTVKYTAFYNFVAPKKSQLTCRVDTYNRYALFWISRMYLYPLFYIPTQRHTHHLESIVANNVRRITAAGRCAASVPAESLATIRGLI